MNAREARALATSTNSERISSEVNMCIKLITEAANNGELSVFFYSYLKDATVKHLEGMGYKVKQECDRNEFLGTISW